MAKGPDPRKPAEVRQRANGKWSASGWVRCGCGKERHVYASEQDKQKAISHYKVLAMTSCKACNAKLMQRLNLCPEVVPWIGGIAACGLPIDHQGRCSMWCINFGYPPWP